MPHLHVQSFKKVNFPSKMGEFKFNFLAKNVNHPEEQLDRHRDKWRRVLSTFNPR